MTRKFALNLIFCGKIFKGKSNFRCFSSVGNCDNHYKVVFFGSDDFSLFHLKILNSALKKKNLINKLNVVSSMSKLKHTGRRKILNSSPVVKYCQEEGLPLFCWPVEDKDFQRFDVGVVVSFGHLIPQSLIQCFPLGILNVHPSLLPRWRGASPIPHTILAGDKVTGVTIMRIKPERFDVGPIIAQEEVEVSDDMTTESLSKILARKGGEMLLKVMGDLQTHLKCEKMQSNEGVTKAPKLNASHGLLNWNMTSCEIDRTFRAVSKQIQIKASWREEEFRLFDMVPLIENKSILQAELSESESPLGSMRFHKPSLSLQIRCQDTWVRFRRIGFGNRKNMSAKEFYNGFLSSDRSGTDTVLSEGRKIQRFTKQQETKHD